MIPLVPVTLFIAFIKCSQWMVLVLSDEVPYVFSAYSPLLGKRKLSVTRALNISFT